MKYVNIWVGMILLLLAWGCADDKGNYDYKDINKLEISGIDGDNWYRKISHADTLKIYPEIKNLMTGKSEGEYDYSWKLIPSDADVSHGDDTLNYVVATTKDLELPVTQKAGKYMGYFNVKDQETGVTWTQKFYLQVSTLTSEGWMVLCEQDEQARMDMIVNIDENTDVISRDIWSEDEFDSGKPMNLFFNYAESYNGGPQTTFVCEKGTYILDREDLHVGEDNNIRWTFGAQPERILVQGSGISVNSWVHTGPGIYDGVDYPLYWVLVDEVGDVYLNTVSELGGLFDLTVNTIDGQKFKAAPFVANAYNYQGYGELAAASTMLYDEAGRFVEIKAEAGRPSVMKFSRNTLFSAEQPGKEMVHLQSTVNDGLTYAVLKDNTGDYYYYGINLGTLGVNTQKYYGKISGAGIDQATHFACHPVLGILFYATKDKVYRLNLKDPKDAEVLFSYPGETIKVLKFNPLVAGKQYAAWEQMRSEHLIVGTTEDELVGENEESCGIIRMYEFSPLWDREPVKKKEYTKLGNILNIVYKEIRR